MLELIGQKRQASDLDNSGGQGQYQQKRQKTGMNNSFNNRAGKIELRVLVQSKVKKIIHL